VAAGFEKVRRAIDSGAVGVVVVASDAATDGRQRLARMASGVPMVDTLGAAELAAAIGREHVVYLAVKKGRLADRFAAEAARLAGFRKMGTDAEPA
jgi:ribosomal protein L7Ae-like RNA K-turn-binding protein